MTVTDTPPLEDPDPEFTKLLEKLGPALLATAQAAVDAAISAVPTPTMRPGEVQGVDASTRTATVLVDGDTTPISAQVLTDLPGNFDRVMVMFVPPSAVFVTGLITTSGVPAGTLAPYAGPISAHAGAVSTSSTPGQPPRGWLWCAGQAVSRSDYSALFTAIGTTWGAGNGTTTFNVPDFRGRVPVGLDNMGGSDASRISASNTLGGTGGSNTITQAMLPNASLSVSGSVTINDPGHTHGTTAQEIGGGTEAPGTGITIAYQTASIFSATTGITASLSGATASLGGSGSEHLPPYALVHILIKT